MLTFCADENVMTHQYSRAPRAEGLRLHLNENTGGCSPRVIEAIRRIDAQGAAFYPEYDEAVADCAAHIGVAADRVALTNGLDEGILLAALAFLDPASQALIPEPTFEMYAVYVDAMRARRVAIPPRPDFSFPLDETLAAIGDRMRLVFLTNPNNPTGQRIPVDAIRMVAARAAEVGATVFLDEAYCLFSGDTFVGELDRFPNVLVGRTFAKSHALAGLRIGALVGTPGALGPIRRVLPPYNINVCAVAALRAALADTDHMRRYAAEVEASKSLLYAACDRLGLPYWPSAANFVLVRAGDRAARLVDGLAYRGILVRDKSQDPACPGCVRIGAGLLEHTRACVAAMEETLCGAP